MLRDQDFPADAEGLSSAPPSNANISIHAYRCSCKHGYTGGYCSYKYKPIFTEECTVAESTSSRKYTGNCDVDEDECKSKPCQNGAVCDDSGSTKGEIEIDDYRCTCAAGFANGWCTYGHISEYNVQCTIKSARAGNFSGNCDIDVNECDSNPCKNGAVCSDSNIKSSPEVMFVQRGDRYYPFIQSNATLGAHRYRCTCAPGFANGLCMYPSISAYHDECTIARLSRKCN